MITSANIYIAYHYAIFTAWYTEIQPDLIVYIPYICNATQRSR